MMPSLSVVQTVPSRRRNDAPALSSPRESQPAVEQAVDEPLETDRHFVKLAPEPRGDAVDHAAATPRSCRRPHAASTADGCENR